MANSAKMLHLPDMVANWPWKRSINPYYDVVKAESSAWFRSFKAFSEQSQHAFDKCDFARLAALAYPLVCREHLRTGCDLMNLFFVIDEYTDVEPAPVVREMVDTVIDALNNPHKPRPEGEVILGEVARQFWELAIKTATPLAQRHMIETFVAYLDSVVEQARDRDNETLPSVRSYIENRRENVGTKGCFAIFELGCEIPDEVLYHPAVTELINLASEMVMCGNDMDSYNREQATGDDRHNILTVIMNEFGIGLEEAQTWVVKLHADLEKQFLEGMMHIPSWNPDVDKQIQLYLDGVGHFIRASDCWHFEAGRYFGDKGLEIQKSRRVPLLPKIIPPRNDETLRRENIVVALIETLETNA
ncbi:terpenoid synthase [Fomitiporia mediterranea MF3/22]|uniref:terpenoid synthase n=1 Tax=Fomitiporia mediterranea (strain MF3/22) TaxID=694068 RepID=UPI000440953A|nr:terpenoid synthase [Fomitiporia mediterranea MF3/22]EJD05130.1 terpenoid synthase [Fomitiporia mediterranea MF3/22]